MPNWHQLLMEIRGLKDLPPDTNAFDVTRKRYLAELAKYTKRNVIVYYSGWLQKPQLAGQGFIVNDNDISGLMAVIHGMEKDKGLDLILHTPGGSTTAAEAIVKYLRSIFGTDIRAVVPQLAMSAGTMIACASREIVMGKHSSLGPYDPQVRGVPAQGVLDEFERAHTEVWANPSMAAFWQPFLAKYPSAFVGECLKALKMSDLMVGDWLSTGMFAGEKDPRKKAKAIIKKLGKEQTMVHDRHLSIDDALKMGLKVLPLEKDPKLQEAVLTVHHACIATLSDMPVVKIIENHLGVSVIESLNR